MEGIDGHSAACCNIPPVISEGYEPKGKYETIGGLKTYVTGPASAKKAVLVIYDIFGFFPQTIQGADILASSEGYQVVMPDFFEGVPADITWCVAKIPQVLVEVELKYGKKAWAALGFCWGGKVVALTSGSDTPWKVSAQCHPGLLDAADAAKVIIPMAVLGSEEETAEDIEAFGNALKVEKHIERFGDQLHGWMSARADLEDEKVRKEYDRGYKVVLEFFKKYL